MPKKQVIGVATSDKCAKTRRVEIDRMVRHPKYGKIMQRRTVCHVHDENNESGMGEVSKNLRSLDKSLNDATSSARKFAARPMRTLAEETVAKPAAETPAEPDAAPASAAAPQPAEGEERAAG